MDLRTNYRQDFVPHESNSPPTSKRSKSTDEQVFTRRPMNEISQTSFDFRAYPKHRPPPAAEMETFLSQIKLTNPLAPETKFVEFVFDFLFFFSHRLSLGGANIEWITKVLIPVVIHVLLLPHQKIAFTLLQHKKWTR